MTRRMLSLVRRAVRFELRLYGSLARWVARRPDVGGVGVEPFGYARLVTPVMGLWIFASAVEVPVVHLLLPWSSVRIVALALGIWGLLWMLGFLAGLQMYPHLFTPAALRVRQGATVDIEVPWEAVASIAVERRNLPSSIRTLQPAETERGTDLQVAVSGEVNVHLELRGPTVVRTPAGERAVIAVSFLADDPRELVARVRRHLEAAADAAA